MKFRLRLECTSDPRLREQVGGLLPEEFVTMKGAIEFLDNHYLTSNIEIVTLCTNNGRTWCTPVSHRQAR